MLRTQLVVGLVCSLFVLAIAGCSSSSGPISVSLMPQVAYIGSGQTMQFSAVVINSKDGVTYSLSGSGATGSVDSNGNFTAPTVTQNATATLTATSVKDSTKTATATINIIAPGTVTTTANSQVALYTITVPDGLSAFVQFSTDTSYNLPTAAVAAPSGGGAVPILVAGMRGNTQYHMRAVFEPTGSTTIVFTDADHTFTTVAYPAGTFVPITAAAASGQTPQPGVELLDIGNGVITDLNGNILWAYAPGSIILTGAQAGPIKPLPNGHFLINFADPVPDGTNSILQEVDFANHVYWQLNAAQLNAALSTATCAGCNIQVIGTHHDFAMLPNGHLIVIASTIESIAGIPVYGDVLIDLDQNHNPVWLWNEFDHLDINRRPMGFPDWTHTNAITYSPDDKALMFSSRHQAWVIKVNYNDGAGDGSIIWKLGYQGDFNLLPGPTNSQSPVDWFNAQHDANIISTNTTGVIQVTMFDNGNQRILDSSGTLCGPTTTPCDSRVPILQVDETAKTAEITWVDKLAPVFSFFGGSSRLLANGNLEFDECAPTPTSANVFEVTVTTPPTTVWSMQIGEATYRAYRIPSPYPGVQW